jgi:3-oxosteroid 1-dehydrogenase
MSIPGDDRARSRRRFLVHTAAVAGLGALARPATATQSTPRSWASSADVIVVGSGAAGLSAAITAAVRGSSVVIVEKAPAVGGTTAKSDGAYWVPNNHIMRANGVSDPRNEAIGYMVRCSYPALFRDNDPHWGVGANEFALLESFYDNAAKAIESLEACGALKSTTIALPDYLDHVPFNKPMRERILIPMKSDGQIGEGRELVRQLHAKVQALNIQVLTKHTVTRIERNSRGEVLGLAVGSAEGTSLIRAKKAVIFASGGFTHNPGLVLNFQPAPNWGGCAVPTNQGDFVRLGIEAGAMLGNMVNAWRAQLLLESALESASVPRDLWQPPGDSMILVNKYAQRVVNEKRNYNERTRAHFAYDPVESEYPNLFLFMVYDQRTADLFAGNFPLPEPGDPAKYVIKGADIGGLAQAIQARLDSLSSRIGKIALAPDFTAALSKQIDAFNHGAAAGVDPQFRRGEFPYDTEWHTLINSKERSDTRWPANTGKNPTVHPIEKHGPFYAIILAAGTLDTNGGPVINGKSQVLDTHGNPIPGLYGAGNCIASPAAQGYWGAGGTIGPALTFGTLAGQGAADEAVKEEV